MKALHATRRILIVAIDGAGGSGKSRLADALRTRLTASHVPTSIVEVDDFFLPSARRPRGSAWEKPIGGDFDWQRLRQEVLEPLRRGEAARYGRYDWAADEMAGVSEVSPHGVVIVEGVYASRRELASFYDLRIWVECPRELRLSRGLARDGETARKRWEEDWMPGEDRYIEEHRPQERADAVVRGTDMDD
jgi:uridine kinase